MPVPRYSRGKNRVQRGGKENVDLTYTNGSATQKEDEE